MPGLDNMVKIAKKIIFFLKKTITMAETVLLKSSNASKKRKSNTPGGNKSKKSLASPSSAKISESFEESLLILLMNNAPTTAYNENEGSPCTYNENEVRGGLIKRTFHLGGSKYVIFHGSQGLIEHIYLKDWEDGEVKNKGIKLSVPKLVVILHYVGFIMSSIKNV